MVSRVARRVHEAARRAAPHAVQVADRLHLLKNLRGVVLWVFKQHTEVLDLVPTLALHFQRLTNLRLDRSVSKERMREQARKLSRSERGGASGVTELKAVAVKLLQDTAAVVAVMILPYSELR